MAVVLVVFEDGVEDVLAGDEQIIALPFKSKDALKCDDGPFEPLLRIPDADVLGDDAELPVEDADAFGDVDHFPRRGIIAADNKRGLTAGNFHADFPYERLPIPPVLARKRNAFLVRLP